MGNTTSCPHEIMPTDPYVSLASLLLLCKLCTNAKRPYREPFISGSDINFTAHHVGWIIAGFFGRGCDPSTCFGRMQTDLLYFPSHWLGCQRMVDQEAPRVLYEANAAALYRSDSVHGTVLCCIFLVLILLVRRIGKTTGGGAHLTDHNMQVEACHLLPAHQGLLRGSGNCILLLPPAILPRRHGRRARGSVQAS